MRSCIDLWRRRVSRKHWGGGGYFEERLEIGHMRKARLISGFCLKVDEISALSIRQPLGGPAEVIAVGDENFVIERSVLIGDQLHHVERAHVKALLPQKVRHSSAGSEWEGVATDGGGRVFALREDTATIFAFSDDFDHLNHTIKLVLDARDDALSGKLVNDPNAGPEGVLLLKDGHLLVVKQRDPVAVIEFGLPSGYSKELGSNSYLSRGKAFKHSKGRHTKLVPLRSWTLSAIDEARVQSANDLAVDRERRLHVISSRSRCIFELAKHTEEDGALAVVNSWMLPKELKPDKHRKAEGLAFDKDNRPLVAIDAHDRDENVFLLRVLER